MTHPAILGRRALARTVFCPVCEAEVGMACSRITGRVRGNRLPVQVHCLRYDLADGASPFAWGYATAKAGRALLPEGLTEYDREQWLQGAAAVVTHHPQGALGLI